MPDIRLNRLEGFYHVARLGNYTKAAQAFSYPIGQPAVYQQVKGLQEDLGVALVRQIGPRRTELTPEGRALYEFLAPFFEGLPRLTERLGRGDAEPVVLAADQLLAMEALPEGLRKARAALPGVRARVLELSSEEIVRQVAGGEAEAGLLYLPAAPRGLRWELLGRIGVALLIPARHPLARLGRPPTHAEIAKHPLIAYERRSPGRQLAERLFREAGAELLIAAEVTFAQTMRAMVREGLAPAFVPYVLPARGNPAPPRLPRESGTVCLEMSARLKVGDLSFGLLYRPGTEESPAFRALAQGLREAWG